MWGASRELDQEVPSNRMMDPVGLKLEPQWLGEVRAQDRKRLADVDEPCGPGFNISRNVVPIWAWTRTFH